MSFHTDCEVLKILKNVLTQKNNLKINFKKITNLLSRYQGSGKTAAQVSKLYGHRKIVKIEFEIIGNF